MRTADYNSGCTDWYEADPLWGFDCSYNDSYEGYSWGGTDYYWDAGL